jgi:hypothetical protein
MLSELNTQNSKEIKMANSKDELSEPESKDELSKPVLDAAQTAGKALGDFLVARQRDAKPTSRTARGQRIQQAAYEAEISVEMAAANIKRFLELQNHELRSLIMRAATLKDDTTDR